MARKHLGLLLALALAAAALTVSSSAAAERPARASGGGNSGDADIQPRDLVVDERGLGYLRRSDGSLTPYGHSIAAANRPIEPRAPGGKPGRPGGGGDDGTVTFGQWDFGGQVLSSAGRILFEMSDGWYVCSGTAVTDSASGRSIVLTAAHCIYDDIDKAFAVEALFIPNQDDGETDDTDWDCSNDEYGCWILDHGVVDLNWTTQEFPDNIPWDYGYYVVSDTDARSQNTDYTATGDGALDLIVGTLGVDFTAPDIGTDAHALGYSYDVDPQFMYCKEPLATESSYGDYWLDRCDMSGGSSGGPWVQPMTESTGVGPVFSVNSWGYTNQPGMGGPLLHGTSANVLFGFAQTSSLGSASGGGYIVDPSGTPVNTPPTVTITSPADGASVESGTSVSFAGSASDDEDGNLTASLVWMSNLAGEIGTGGSFNAVLTDGTHTITASVTDSGGLEASATVTVTVEPATPEPPSELSLSVNAYKVRGVKTADLQWSGAEGTSVVVFRNGAAVTTTANDGVYTDSTGQKGGGSTTYQVCESGTTDCSNSVTVTW